MRKWTLLTEAIIVLLLIMGCAKKPMTAQASAPAPAQGISVRQQAPTAETVVRPASRSDTKPGARPSPSEFEPVSALNDIHFDFDKYEIRPEDAKILNANAEWLKSNRRYLVLIEGHCDERGTSEYNLALGDRRAKAAVNYLLSRGVMTTRINTVSYGKEHPQCAEHNEVCWAKNRRAHSLAKAE